MGCPGKTKNGIYGEGAREMKRVAVVGAILENPQISQKPFNDIVSLYKDIIKGRIGVPMEEADMAVVSLVLTAELDEINAFMGKLGNLRHVTVKTAISEKDLDKL
jgi:putative iron-only hydrogenase system regulator